MKPEEINDAVTAARLLVRGSCSDLTAESARQVARALVVFATAYKLEPARCWCGAVLPHEVPCKLCLCGRELPHETPCQFSTDPEAT